MTPSPLKGKLRTYLIKKRWYEYIKYSYFFYLYEVVFKKDKIRQHKKEVSFYKSFIQPCNLVFDIGAYDGHKTSAFLEISKRVVCCEPDEQNFRTLSIRFRGLREKVFIEKVALSDREQTGTLYVHHQGSAFNTMNEKWKHMLEADNLKKWDEKISFSSEAMEVKLTTLDALIKKFGIPDFIKIDAEGYEKWILNGLSQKVNLISFESLLPEFKDELDECISRIEHLSAGSLYNISINEQLQFPDFISKDSLQNWIDSADVNHFEVIAKMY